MKGGTYSSKLCIMLKLDLLDIYQWGCGPFFVSLLTDKHLKGFCIEHGFVYIFSTKGVFTSVRDA